MLAVLVAGGILQVYFAYLNGQHFVSCFMEIFPVFDGDTRTTVMSAEQEAF